MRQSAFPAVVALIAALTHAPATAADAGVGTPAAAPVVTAFSFRPATLRPGFKGAFRFTTSREGAGSIALARQGTGGRAVPLGRLRFAVDAGEGKKSFDGKIGGRRLKAGRYRATLTVTNSSTSVPRRLTFRIAAR
ncbi:MAG: hypothetical protein JWO02_4531 [Solirubrobacterales bacterium]|nr:hypothetical protein [Solirubrobacterales bacterium]